MSDPPDRGRSPPFFPAGRLRGPVNLGCLGVTCAVGDRSGHGHAPVPLVQPVSYRGRNQRRKESRERRKGTAWRTPDGTARGSVRKRAGHGQKGEAGEGRARRRQGTGRTKKRARWCTRAGTRAGLRGRGRRPDQGGNEGAGGRKSGNGSGAERVTGNQSGTGRRKRRHERREMVAWQPGTERGAEEDQGTGSGRAERQA